MNRCQPPIAVRRPSRQPLLAATLLGTYLLLAGSLANAADKYRQAVIAEPYLELHTGPAAGYPVTTIVERGETIEILKRRTDWLKIRTADGRTGWAWRDAMENAMTPDGDAFALDDDSREDFVRRRFEMGMMSGDFGGANLIGVYGAVSWSDNLSTEIWVSQGLGRFSNSVLAGVNVVHEFFPGWRISPQFSLGTGMIRTSPNATLVETEDRTDQIAHAGLGVRAYLTRQFVLRAEYKTHVVFTSRDDNEEIDEWKAGFAFFF